jgi:DNA invertase Pin-like site-specific DNA recombinase
MPTRTAYSYLRFSTPEQARGDSLRRQLDAARTFARANDLTLDESLRDLGRSAFSGAHRTKGALGAFLDAVKEGRVARGSVLIVESLDRLSREQVLDALEQFRAILMAGVEIVTLSDGQRYTEESVRKEFTQLLVSLLVMARAYEESARKGERVGAAWGQKRLRAANGEAMTRACVAWCRVVGAGRNSRYELIPERAAIVRRIFRMAADGMGRRQIVKCLNGEGVPAFGRGAGWQDSYVAKILENRATLGFYQPHRLIGGRRVAEGDEVAGYYPAVVSEDEFHLARAAIQRRRGKGGPTGHGAANLLSGLARCGACGAAMVHLNKGAGPKGGRYLSCDRKRRGLACDNPVPNVRYDAAERLLLVGLLDVDWRRATQTEREGERPEDERDRLLARVGEIDRDLEAVLAAFGAASDITQVRLRVERLQAEKVEAQRRAAELATLVAVQRADETMSWSDRYERLIEELRTAQGEELVVLRLRARAEIARVVREVRFLGEDVTVLGRENHVSHEFKGYELLRRGPEHPRRPAWTQSVEGVVDWAEREVMGEQKKRGKAE